MAAYFLYFPLFPYFLSVNDFKVKYLTLSLFPLGYILYVHLHM